MSDPEEDKLYSVETVPPPAGENDAYNAPTRVGQMVTNTIAEMLLASGGPVSDPPGPPGRPASPGSPLSTAPGPLSSPPVAPEGGPRLNDPSAVATGGGEDSRQSKASATDAPRASFEPTPLTPATPPVFTRAQWLIVLAVTCLSAAAVYFLFT
jgi:hypothetical protein